MMCWMLNLVTCVCIVKRCRPVGISTLNVRVYEGNVKQYISWKGTERNTYLDFTQLMNITQYKAIKHMQYIERY
ncbi:hypothetical protein MTR67_039533 [Solanum verrucosum]|uniref:Uncharacterized protein n=1 Tax=Solanum verrucosum TaxID=315347 RepID=A0AAF0UH26_SOLVR|nr:hypothetical protein MTR67_039533 [Solanum verrucosum]